MGIPILAWLDDPHPRHGIHAAGEDLTYVELARRIRLMATGFGARGVGPGDVVRLALPPGTDFVVAAYGALLAGAAISPLAPDAPAPSVPALGGSAPGGLLLAGSAEVAEICAAGDPSAAPPGPGPGALVQLTSGSSGAPRGVRIGWPALTANVSAIVDWLRMTCDDRVASWLPFHHDMGLVGILVTSLATQADLTLLTPSDFIRNPAAFVRLFDRGGATLTAMPAFGLRHIVRRVRPDSLAGLDLSGWRGLIVGAERIDPEVLRRFEARLAPARFSSAALLPAYGLAEATLIVTGARLVAPPTILPDIVGCGYPVGDATVSIVDEEGRGVGEGVTGEIVVRGSSLASGYMADGHTAFNGDLLRTGDAGFLRDGELFVVGRFGDSLKVHGRTLFAEDLEALAVDAGAPPGQVAVLTGVHSGQSTAVLVAERLDPATRAAAADAVRAALGPARLVVVDAAILRTTSGKPRRRVLWQAYTAGAFD